MKTNIHHIFAGITFAAIGGGALAMAAHSNPTPEATLAKQFTPADHTVFTEGFRTADGLCEVGYAQQDICFESSHLEDRIIEGERFPADMYPLSLEWRAELAMSRKQTTLKTIRIGQTVALLDRDTRIIVDTIRLGEQPRQEMAQNSRAS